MTKTNFPEMIIFIGIPASGKSTFYRQNFAVGYPDFVADCFCFAVDSGFLAYLCLLACLIYYSADCLYLNCSVCPENYFDSADCLACCPDCFENRFGDNYKDAFKTLRTALLNLLKDGAKKDYTAIKNNPINSSIKAKILAMYYPDKYMNVYSLKHLDYYLTTLGLNTKELMKSDVLYKREALVDFKNEDDDMKNWSNYVFSIFLWAHYPKDPRCVTDF